MNIYKISYFSNLKRLFSAKEKLSAETTKKHFYPLEYEYLNKGGIKFIKKIILKKKTIKISYGLNTAGLAIFVLDFKNGALAAARRYYKNVLYDEYSYESYYLKENHFNIFKTNKPFDFINFITTILLSTDKVYRKHYSIHSAFQSNVAYQMIYYNNNIVAQNKTTFNLTKVDSFLREKIIIFYVPAICMINLLNHITIRVF